MSSKTLDKKFEGIIEEDIVKQPINLKQFIIPFSEFGRSTKYIYLGTEKIPFRERYPTYQMILTNEFAKAIKEFQETLK
ncbi:MAG: hypothetical protein ACFFCE_17365 [Promethearchaeota archaeon]